MTVAPDVANTKNRYVIFELPFPLRLRDSVPGEGQHTQPLLVGVTPPCELSTVLIMSKTATQGLHGLGELEGGDPFWVVSDEIIKHRRQTRHRI